jgi:protein required for attachment to host cells
MKQKPLRRPPGARNPELEMPGTVRVVVADRAEARFYDVAKRSPLRIAGHLSDETAHLHDRDLKSDRPGRVFDRAPFAKGRRGAVGHHAATGRQSPRRHAADLFARRISVDLGRARRAGEFDWLVLMAGPPFLGTLRCAMAKQLQSSVILQVPKDLVHQPVSAVRAHLPRSWGPRQ